MDKLIEIAKGGSIVAIEALNKAFVDIKGSYKNINWNLKVEILQKLELMDNIGIFQILDSAFREDDFSIKITAISMAIEVATNPFRSNEFHSYAVKMANEYLAICENDKNGEVRYKAKISKEDLDQRLERNQ